MFDATGLAKYVEATLELETEANHEEIRAAAYMLVALGRVYIWPIHDFDNHLALAIAKLEEIKALEIYQDSPGLVRAIDEEIVVLRSRLKKPKQ